MVMVNDKLFNKKDGEQALQSFAVRVEDHRERENEGDVEAVPEHCDRMPGVLVEGFPRVPLAVLCVQSVSLRVTPSA
jgi:hypothetical protein